MKKLLMVSALLLQGCLFTKVAAPQQGTSDADEKEILFACQELSKLGDLTVLFDRIHLNVGKIHEISDQQNPAESLDDLEILRGLIKKDIESAKSMLDPKFMEIKWKSKLEWDLDLVRSPTKISVEALTVNGEILDHLKHLVVVSKKDDKVKIIFERKTSALDICELQDTLGIILKVTYGNVIRVNQYFKLIVKK